MMLMPSSLVRTRFTSIGLALVVSMIINSMDGVAAHEHHELTDIDMGEPIDSMLWIHMTLQLLLWGVSFPIGMILGLSKSRYHVPLQSINVLLTLCGILLGHHHRGRQFPATAHGILAKVIFWIMLAQATIGCYLKVESKLSHPRAAHHRSKTATILSTLRPTARLAHRILGVTFPLLGWTQMLLGIITLLSYCFGGTLGQCLAHYIMGSAFIAYATIMILMMTVGQAWLMRTGQSQEYLDSWVICIWGVINTFTMHHDAWDKNWSHKDMQHTMMGVLWWTGGALGIFLSRKGRRSFVPAVIVIMTGWGMSAHEQALMISTKIHALFGYSLMAAGVVRIIEVCFVLNDQPASAQAPIRIIQYLPPYLLTLGGTMFMSATDEEMHKMDDLGVDHVSYGLFVFSLSFLVFLNILFLTHLYSNSGQNSSLSPPARGGGTDAAKEEGGYTSLADLETSSATGPDVYELTEQDGGSHEDGLQGYGGTDRVDNAASPGLTVGKDEVDWLDESRPMPWVQKAL